MYKSVNQIVAEWNKVNAEFLGGIINFSVSVPKDNPVTDVQISNAIKNNPVLPDEWAPNLKPYISLYLQTLKEVTNMSSKKLDIPNPDDFDLETHGGYSMTKLFQDKFKVDVCAHRVFHKRSKVTQVSDGKVDLSNLDDIEYENSIVLTFRRVTGMPSLDAERKSTFEIHVTNDNGSDIEVFKPFIHTLTTMFEDKIKGTYTTDQVRDYVSRIIKSEIGADNISRGMYFVPAEKMDKLIEFKKEMSQISRGIDIFFMPLPKFKTVDANSPLNQSLQNVQVMLSDSILKDATSLLDDVKTMSDSDKTRQSTWQDRAEAFRELKKKIESYRNRSLLVEDMLSDSLDEIKEIIVDNI